MRHEISTALAIVALASLAALASPATAAPMSVLHSFCGSMGCRGGNDPIGLARDASDNLYGTTYFGGKEADGTIFEMTPDGTSWRYKVLHDFCVPPSCADSTFPTAAPIVDVNGNLYGTTLGSQSDDFGVIYELSPDTNREHWKYTVLYRFAGPGDGLAAYGGLSYAGQASGELYDGVSALYGTTSQGGPAFRGTVYRLVPKTGTRKWRYDVLHEFCVTDCADGAGPYAGVLVGPTGTLYGTTSFGGNATGSGTVFALMPDTRGKTWTATTLYSFCSAAACADGAAPFTPLLIDGDGSLYGTTQAGAPCNAPDGCGVLFKLSPEAGGWRERVLHTFCSEKTCADGASPGSPLLMDGKGRLLGTTQAGGSGDGVLFAFGKTFRVLHGFCAACAEGGKPHGPLLLDDTGALLGVTVEGGAKGGGTVYALHP